MDYKALGLKCGLEVHQQLDTHKLFCEDLSRLSERTEGTFVRRLRPTQSELGEVDAAAVEEARRRLSFMYQITDNTCLVEADEEPPHEANREALETALLVSLMLKAQPVREVHFMRKIVIDGSNTTGFQRSALIAVDGTIEIDGKRIGIPTILLEEEAARQLKLIDVAKQLNARGVTRVDLELHDVTSILASSESRVVRSALSSGGRVLGGRLPGFRGLLKEKLGPEFAAHARVAGIEGILHSDELPGHGVTPSETDAVAGALGVRAEDAFVLVAAEEAKARRAFDEMLPRIRAALAVVPEKTRDPKPDGTTQYSRPLPGKARMYPETDVPPIRVTDAWLEALTSRLPEPPEARASRLAKRFDIHEH